MPTTTSPITEQRFTALEEKLRELFELDKSELDFGIYRIMAAKNDEITEFLDRQLKTVVRETLETHGAGAADQIRAEIEDARQAAEAAGFNPDDSPKVKELNERLESAGGASIAELEADIYNHLLAFFSRYYDEGDFISKRRYKGDTYAIPYSGEEVVLHWANKDQYYIKSGEWHKDYRFKLPDGRRVRFALVDATQETGNNKEPDEAKRRYIISVDEPVVAEGDTLTLQFEFRVPTEDERAEAADGVVAIFGGDYAKEKAPKKGDERTQFCADAEQFALEHMPTEWRRAVTAAAVTDDKPQRTLLGKHLDAFTARNTFDYFIHKDLGGFLRRELDFYIKNEVVRLDDLDTATADHLQRVQGRVRAIRRVASKVIELLESLENFQKKLWLKKKFVLGTSWLVTVDRVPESLRDVVAKNKAQWVEWERLGFKPDGEAGGLFGGAEWGTRGYLDACDKLVVDTRLFDEAFTAELLASDEILRTAPSLEDATSGVLVHSENHQGLSLLSARYESAIDSIYIDPPYNSDGAPIVYKNGYKSSSWLALIADRLRVSLRLMQKHACYALAIDDFEMARLCELCDGTLLGHDRHVAIVNHHPQGGMSANMSRTHEYMLVLTPHGHDVLRGKPKSGETEYRSFALSGPGTNKSRLGRPNSFYAVLIDRDANRVVGIEKPPRLGEAYPTEDTPEGWERRYPIGPGGAEKVWCRSYESAVDGVQRGEIVLSEQGVLKLAVDTTGKRDSLMSNWTDSRYNAGPHGTGLVADIVGDRDLFSYPKSLHTVVDSIEAMTWPLQESTILDYFAGSGTTGHAVIALNRSGGPLRRFVMIEMGEYFDLVIRSRMAKVVYSPDWKDGKAQSHDQGLSALVKCFAVESYEDALNNLPAPTGGMFHGRPAEEADALIRYALDLEMGPSLLDLDIFRDPWGHAINAQLAGDDEIKPHRVDLVETFNYLIGLRVSAYGPIERYTAEFTRADHDDELGRLKIDGRLRRDPDGPFVFQRIEGVLNDDANTRVLIVWRKLLKPDSNTDDSRNDAAEKDAAVLDAWMERHRQETTERTEHRDYHRIYINGPITLPQPTQELRTVLPIEQTFKDRMFEDDEVSAHG